ncbi:MAG TPA: NAD(P)/FAD-dependent oxidoreductase [bacterium]|nr:NAD(P)/FAD-dependent oxidoreductase [bacterium]HPS29531.1 NAD(P)/FAD-dependent oxidoreductase [bacterium]
MSNQSDKSEITIIGAGAAGLMCAAMIDERFKTVLIEKSSEIGIKLRISGSGQCNLTHSGDVESFIRSYGDNGRFLKKALYGFSNKNLADYFSERKVPVFEREDGKMFPESLNSKDVIDALKNEILRKKHSIKTNLQVNSITYDNLEKIFKVKTGNGELISEIVVISTGGRSYPQTGSTGDGYTFAQSLGHRIIKTTPALVPFIIQQWPFAQLSGNSFKNASITLKNGISKISRNGELLITHKGISGPLVLDFSRYPRSEDTVIINFFADFNAETAAIEITELFSSKPSAKIENTFFKIGIPQNFSLEIIKLAGIDPSTLCGSVSKKQIRSISELLCRYQVDIIKDSYDHAMVTKGGVDLNEVNAATMRSKIIEELYFCGEVLDIDGDTGGYNIQAAFSTAVSAATDINKILRSRIN